MKIPYKEKFDPSEIPEGVIAIPFAFGPSYDGPINGRKRYTKEQYLQALEDKRLVELYCTDSLGVQYCGSQYAFIDTNDLYVIDPAKTIGTVYALDDDNLYIKKGNLFDETIPECIRPKLKVFLRCTCDFAQNTFKIIAWDILDGELDDMNAKICNLFDEYVPLIVDICTTNEDTIDTKAKLRNQIISYFISNMIYGKQSIHEMLINIRAKEKTDIEHTSNSCDAMYMDN